jgi:hypothetical protein
LLRLFLPTHLHQLSKFLRTIWRNFWCQSFISVFSQSNQCERVLFIFQQILCEVRLIFTTKLTEFSLQHQTHLCLCEVHIVQQFHKLNKFLNYWSIKWTHQNKNITSDCEMKWNENWENSQTNNSKCPNIWFLAVLFLWNWFRSHPTNRTNSTLCLYWITQSSLFVIFHWISVHSFQMKEYLLFLHLFSQEFVTFQNPKHNNQFNKIKFVSIVNCQFSSFHMFNQIKSLNNIQKRKIEINQ